MPKKIIEEVEPICPTPIGLVSTDFGREDMNALRDAVNALIEAHNSA